MPMPKKSVYSKKYHLIINLLAQERLKKEMTQGQVAAKLKRPQSYVAKYELCERRLDIVEFMDVCRALNLRPSKVMVLTQ